MTPQDWQALIDKYGAAFWNGIAAPVWEVAVRQAYVAAVQNFVWGGGFIVVAIVTYRLAGRTWTKRNKLLKRDTDNRDRYGVPEIDTDEFTLSAVVLYVATILVSIMAVAFLTDAVSHLINPQWYALQNLLGTVKK